ncbi:MAG TPA: hypothetical protein VKD22_15080, partial [Ramlibacter sp.]|nr:hypothetical protein [Ramlibacter sp.]
MGLGAALALQALGQGLTSNVGGAIQRIASSNREAAALAHERDREKQSDDLQAASYALQGIHAGTAPTVQVAAAPPPVFRGASLDMAPSGMG